ncbi:CheA signal transduction histidine kinase [Nitrosospira multiformis]|uniref:Chemotaxis protein CheA n=1 Tax=Nitrosospira multiformis TaxID=1231 RepID=A0A1I0AAX9_9PROT|nr:hybrid sensor histidine kinase/response regulator [Nitrosospira multiformis]SES90873.1 CheA signal transduction histidine kinase [Nitrosospira multiformis]
MPDKRDVLLQRLLAMFRIEAEAHLKDISSGLLALEGKPVDTPAFDIIENMLRCAHSLKGAARAVNFAQVEETCRSLENVFSALKDKSLAVSSSLIDRLLGTVDALGTLVSGEGSMAERQKPLLTTITRQLDETLKSPIKEGRTGSSLSQAASPLSLLPPDESSVARADVSTHLRTSTSSHASATIRVPTVKLEKVLRQVEELLLPCLTARQRAKELGEITATLATWKKQRLQIQSAVRIIDRELTSSLKDSPFRGQHGLPKLLKYLDGEPLQMKALEERLVRLQRTIEQDQRALAGMTDCLIQDVKEMQLLPFSTLLDILPRFSRELAREQGKSLELVVSGGEVEIDRHILEEMKDPLIHLVRNCIDHGIEQPAARLAKGKPSSGRITFACSQSDSGKAEIRVADDGGGINIGKLKAAARKLGVMSEEEMEQLGESELLALIFRSGVTTSPLITDISGRGLGLAIVREKVEALGGSIKVKSSTDTGTAFHILLPLTLTNTRGVLVHAGGQLFVIPSSSVERVVRIAKNEIQTVKNRETILVDEQPVSLVRLNDILELARNSAEMEPTHYLRGIVLSSGLGRVVFLVEEVLGEQEVVIKALLRPLKRVRNVAGVCMLGTGRVVPVLNVPDLLKSAVKASSATFISTQDSSAEKQGTSSKHSILVVDDSITARTLLKHILESAGYSVTTAVDGVEGYTALKTGAYSLVVSDVEMPRMDGFALTAKIRADKQLAALPVVLVTALDSRDHRERGIDVGANAYIVKSRFDQSNLLEATRRLISISSIKA